MINLLAASAAFLLLHLAVSGTRLRDAFTRAIGERPYLALFSLASLAGLVWLAAAYNQALLADNPRLFSPPLALYHLAPLVMLVAVLLAVIGILTPSPTLVMAEGLAARAEVVRGILTVTRHPFLWGTALWALTHLLLNGDRASLILFGSLLVLAVAGTFSIDAKRRRRLGASWEGFAARTSNLPFAAIAAGRARLDLAGLGLWRVGAALLVYGAFLFYLHGCLFEVSPMPGVIATGACFP